MEVVKAMIQFLQQTNGTIEARQGLEDGREGEEGEEGVQIGKDCGRTALASTAQG